MLLLFQVILVAKVHQPMGVNHQHSQLQGRIALNLGLNIKSMTRVQKSVGLKHLI